MVAVVARNNSASGRHVLDDLGNGDTVAITHLGVDQPADAQSVGEVGAELVRGVGDRAVLGRVPDCEVEEVDDADSGVAGDAGLLPQVCIGELHLVGDRRRCRPPSTRGRRLIRSGSCTYCTARRYGELVDRAGRHEGLHEVSVDRTGHGAAEIVDRPARPRRLSVVRTSTETSGSRRPGHPPGKRAIDFGAKLGISTRTTAPQRRLRGSRMSRTNGNRPNPHNDRNHQTNRTQRS